MAQENTLRNQLTQPAQLYGDSKRTGVRLGPMFVVVGLLVMAFAIYLLS